jgi:GAF domain-containing protein
MQPSSGRDGDELSRDSSRVAEAMLGLGKALVSELELDQVLAAILDSLSSVVSYDSASISLLDGGSLEIRAVRGFDDDAALIGRRLDLKLHYLYGSILESGTPVVLRDAQADPRFIAKYYLPDNRSIRAWMGIALRVRGESIGLLGLDSHAVGAFGADDLLRAQAIAELAALAVRDSRLIDQATRRLAELEAVNRVGAAVASRLEEKALCESVGESLREIFGAGLVFVALYHESEGKIYLPYLWNENRRQSLAPLRYGEGIVSKVISSGKPVYLESRVEDKGLELGAVDIRNRDRLPKSWLGVPILSGDRVLGALSIQSFEKDCAFSPADVRLLKILASTAGAGIQNARLFQAAKRRVEEASALAEAGRAISESLEIEVVLRRIAEKAASLLTKDSAAVYLKEPDGSLSAIAAVGPIAAQLLGFKVPPGQGIVGRVAAAMRSEIVDDATADPGAVKIPGTDPEIPGERLLAAPLAAAGECIGVMAVWRMPEEGVFSAEDLEFLDGLALHASIAIQNARLHRKAVEAAAHGA